MTLLELSRDVLEQDSSEINQLRTISPLGSPVACIDPHESSVPVE